MRRCVHIVLEAALVALLAGGCGGEEPSLEHETAVLLSRSHQALQQGRLDRAQALALEAVERQPRSADAHFQVGRVLSEMQEFDEAKKAYERAAELDEEYMQAYLNLANNAAQQQKYRAAIRYYQKAAGGYPVQAMVSIGRAYMNLGESDSARWALQEALVADSTNAATHAWLSVLYEDLADFDSAARYSRRAVALDPQNVDYRFLLGSQHVKLGRYKEAVLHLRRVTEDRPWHYGAAYNLGRALTRMGRTEDAERHLLRADSLQQLQKDIIRQQGLVRVDPQHAGNWKLLGDLLREAGRFEEASRAYQRAQALGFIPDDDAPSR